MDCFVARLGHRARLRAASHAGTRRVWLTSHGRSRVVSEDVAREIMRRLDLAGHEPPSSIAAFVDSHLGPDRQLTLRLA